MNEMVKAFEKAVKGCNPEVLEEDGLLYSIIHDVDLEGFRVDFNFHSGTAEIGTKGAEYIVLSRENLYQLLELIDRVDEMYEDEL